jgi:hypothetical protein
MLRSRDALRTIVVFSWVLCGPGLAPGLAQDGAFTLVVEDELSTSVGFDVRVVLEGLSEEPWVPLTVFALRWDPDELKFRGADMDPAIPVDDVDTFSDFTLVEGQAELVVSLICGIRCVRGILPQSRQPLARVSFNLIGQSKHALVEFTDRPLGGPPVVWDSDGEPCTPAMVPGTVSFVEFLRGDGDHNGIVNLADAVVLLSTLFAGRSALCLDPLDTNDDGILNITDPIHLLLHLFQGGPQPPPPFSELGLDSTGDSLGCESLK